jgi:predicted ATP-grasp superfamily ATP-dependent carboligase
MVFEQPHHPILVIAQSGRMLAQMAAEAGYSPLVVDCFADCDTRHWAMQCYQTESLQLAAVQPLLEKLFAEYGITQAVYASGLEAHVETLAFLQQRCRLLGNGSEILKALQDKTDFFAMLQQLGIPYPLTRFTPPLDGDGWLWKASQGEGGAHIRIWRAQEPCSANGYWQRFVAGTPMSVTFLANRAQAVILGFNRQWSADFPSQPFLFAGIASGADLPAGLQVRLSSWLQKLVAHYQLQGLGSMDFIADGEEVFVLEINARIPASAQLYGPTLFNRHVAACLGQPDGIFPAPPSMGYQIVYARAQTRIASDMQWPEWTRDRPAVDAIIPPGQPICSIIAAGNPMETVRQQLHCRQQIITQLLSDES